MVPNDKGSLSYEKKPIKNKKSLKKVKIASMVTDASYDVLTLKVPKVCHTRKHSADYVSFFDNGR